MDQKAQFSFDLMVVISIMLLLFLGLFQFYVGKAEGAAITGQKLSAKAISETLASRMDAVLQAGNGTRSNFNLPQSLSEGENYTIGIIGRRVDIVFKRGSISSLISTRDISSVDLNARAGTQIEISNIEGKIFLQ